MPKDIDHERWLNQREAALYIERSRQGLRDVLERYEKTTGKTIEKLPDGNEVYVKQSEIDAVITHMFPLMARQKGLVS